MPLAPMQIYSADIAPAHAVSFLWAAPAIAAAAAALLAVGGRALERRFGRAVVGGVAVAALGASAGIVLAAVFGVLFAAGPRVLVDALGMVVDVGGVHIAGTLALDRSVAASALAIALAGAWGAVAYARRGELDVVATGRALAAAVAGCLLLVLAENLVIAVLGWEALVLGCLGLVASHRAQDLETTREVARALVVSRVGQAAWLGGMVLLLWGLTAQGAAGPRVVLADVQGTAGAGIEMPTLGDRPRAASLRRVPVGATLGFDEVATQLALRDTAERYPFQEALAARRLGPLPLLPFVYLGVLFGVALLGLAVLVGRPSLCVGVAVLAAVAGLVARHWPLLALSRGALVGVAVAGLGVIAAWLRAARTGRALSSAPVIARAARELGVIPVRDFARAVAWLERRVLGPAARFLPLAAGVVAVVLLLFL
jgi:hypothetical protein